MKFLFLLTLLTSTAFAAGPCPLTEQSVLHCTGEKNLAIEVCVLFPDTLTMHVGEALSVPVEVLENDWDIYLLQSTNSTTVHTINISPNTSHGVYETQDGLEKVSQEVNCQ